MNYLNAFSMLAGVFGSVLLLSVMAVVPVCLISLVKLVFKEKLPPVWHYYVWFLLLIRLIIPYTPVTSHLFVSPGNHLSGLFNLISISEFAEAETDKNLIHINADKNFKDDSRNKINDIYSINSSNNIYNNNTNTKTNIANDALNTASEDKLGASGNLAVSSNHISTEKNIKNVRSIHMLKITVIVWTVGAMSLVAYFLIISMLLRRGMVKKTLPEGLKDISGILSECRTLAGVNQDIRVVFHKHIKVPAIYGVIRPVLLIPEGFPGMLDSSDIKHIILHELCHCKSRDTFTGLVQMLLLIIHWFNPFVWYAFGRMSEDRELLCDSRVLALVGSNEGKSYANTLLNVLERTAYTSLPYSMAGMACGRLKSMERRLKMITFAGKRSNILALCISLFIILAASVGILYINSSAKAGDAINKTGDAGNMGSKAVKPEVKTAAISDVRGGIFDRNGVKLVERTAGRTDYPYGRLTSYIIGLTSRDNKFGLSGIEATMDEKISLGCDVKLTIDLNIQKITDKLLEKAIKDYSLKDGAAAIVLDPVTGEILAMVSKPDFDPYNPPPVKIGAYRNFSYMNKAIETTDEPGAIFKAITAAVALEEGIVKPDDRVNDEPVTVDKFKLKCWKTPNSHGEESFTEAVYNSCNTVFVKQALKLGSDKFYGYIRNFGFFKKTGVLLPSESFPICSGKPTEVDLAVNSMGMRFTVNSMQLVSAYGAIANGGKLMKPQLVKEVTDARGAVMEKTKPEIVGNPVSKETSDTLVKMLEGTVTKGTAANAYVEGYRIAGMTSTAERIGRTYIVSFAGFAPADRPRIACIIRLYNPQGKTAFGGETAAPVAGELMKEILDYLE